MHEAQHIIQGYNYRLLLPAFGLRTFRNNESELEGGPRAFSKEYVLDRIKKVRRTSIGLRLYAVEGNLVNLKPPHEIWELLTNI